MGETDTYWLNRLNAAFIGGYCLAQNTHGIFSLCHNSSPIFGFWIDVSDILFGNSYIQTDSLFTVMVRLMKYRHKHNREANEFLELNQRLVSLSGCETFEELKLRFAVLGI